MNNKPGQLKLKVVWFRNFLGLAIDYEVLNQNYSLTPYYFWPKTEAWEQLKLELDSKFWLTKEEKNNILKTTGDLMNYWFSCRNLTTAKNTFLNDFKEVEVVTFNNYD